MPRNLTLLTDYYQLTMMNGYLKSGRDRDIAVFDMFFRPKGQMTYAVSAGLEQAVDYIKNLRFSADDLGYLKGLGTFSAEFLAYLKDFSFSGDIYAVREGEIVFPGEPILIVRAPLIEAQLIETALLNIINHQTLIATKASRVVTATGGGRVTEFGLRRAQGPDAGIYGARASVIGGASSTSNVLAAQRFGIPPKGTHSHSWVLSFDTELQAFEAFADSYPDNCLLLVDTYDTLKSGVPHAIEVFKKLRSKGHKPFGIRLDSGDLAYLSKKARQMLDEAGFSEAKIFVSNEIDEELVDALNTQGARIDLYGVGTKLITSENMPSLGGVYKLSQIERDGKSIPRMKVSDSLEKMTNPGFKTFYRVYDKTNRMAFADLIALRGEKIGKPLTLTHETERWKRTVLEDYELEEKPVKIFDKGKLVYDCPPLDEISAYRAAQLGRFWDEYKRLKNPHIYKVDLSDGLYQLKQILLNNADHGRV
ncbi:MAG: nicotinate phosphoribosyltransferase [Clostridiales bacterium]|jgi:nicotinate phosphoribosyltransferase|nr:nicotinate phosphoribosyltransferase [Clostridiales bacterium]